MVLIRGQESRWDVEAQYGTFSCYCLTPEDQISNPNYPTTTRIMKKLDQGIDDPNIFHYEEATNFLVENSRTLTTSAREIFGNLNLKICSNEESNLGSDEDY